VERIIRWLLTGDVSVQYLVHLYLLRPDSSALHALRQRMETEGYAARLLSCRNPDGHWGLHYYQPKWTSTHYTLLDLKTLRLSPDVQACREMAEKTLADCMLENGGMNLSRYEHQSDIGVDGMVLNYAAYFAKENPRVPRLLMHILEHQKADGGFHWDEASECGEPHTTICVLEGLGEYFTSGLRHGRAETKHAMEGGVEFLLRNRLFINQGDKRFFKLSYPYRYRYDFLRALEFFAAHGVPFDLRMLPALQWLDGKRKPDGRWTLENAHSGKVHLVMETTGEPSRMITLKALLILNRYGTELKKGEAPAKADAGALPGGIPAAHENKRF
jgi:hypothetical protein